MKLIASLLFVAASLVAAEPKTGPLKSAPVTETERLAYALLAQEWNKIQEKLAVVERETCAHAKIEPCRVDWQSGMVTEVRPPEPKKEK